MIGRLLALGLALEALLVPAIFGDQAAIAADVDERPIVVHRHNVDGWAVCRQPPTPDQNPIICWDDLAAWPGARFRTNDDPWREDQTCGLLAEDPCLCNLERCRDPEAPA